MNSFAKCYCTIADRKGALTDDDLGPLDAASLEVVPE